jgi:hypothetical protein
MSYYTQSHPPLLWDILLYSVLVVYCDPSHDPDLIVTLISLFPIFVPQLAYLTYKRLFEHVCYWVQILNQWPNQTLCFPSWSLALHDSLLLGMQHSQPDLQTLISIPVHLQPNSEIWGQLIQREQLISWSQVPSDPTLLQFQSPTPVHSNPSIDT